MTYYITLGTTMTENKETCLLHFNFAYGVVFTELMSLVRTVYSESVILYLRTFHSIPDERII